MADTAWKQRERRVAQRLKGRRIGPTGKQGPDVDAGWVQAQVKRRRHVPKFLTEALALIRRQAGPERLGIVVLHEHGRHDAFVMMSLADFSEWFMGEADAEKV